MNIFEVVSIMAWLASGVIAVAWYVRLVVEHRQDVKNCKSCHRNREWSSYYFKCIEHKHFVDECPMLVLIIGGPLALFVLAVHVFGMTARQAAKEKLSLREELRKERKKAEAVLDDFLKK